MKASVLVIILLVVASSIFLVIHISNEEPKATPTTQYNNPIGPAQEPPYQLESELLEVNR